MKKDTELESPPLYKLERVEEAIFQQKGETFSSFDRNVQEKDYDSTSQA